MRQLVFLVFCSVLVGSQGFGPVQGTEVATVSFPSATVTPAPTLRPLETTNNAKGALAAKLDGAKPVSLASADFDADGVADLVCGLAEPTGAALSLHRGNVHAIFPHRPEARRPGAGTFPFESPAKVFEIGVRPDFIAAGDFDNDGRQDVVVAEEGGDALFLAVGDGQLGLRPLRAFPLGGHITALTVGEINRADGLADLVIAVDSATGPVALVFEGPFGALLAEPESLTLTHEVSALALGQVVGDLAQDLILTAGRELVVYEGRDRRLTSSAQRRAQVRPPVVHSVALESSVLGVAAGDFVPGRGPRSEVAVLLEDGTLRVLGWDDTSDGSGWSTFAERPLTRTWEADEPTRSPRIVPARLSGAAAEDLIMFDPGEDRLRFVPGHASHRPGADPSAEVQSIGLRDHPVAVLPMRLSPAAQHQLVVATRDWGLGLTMAGFQATLTVDSAADTAVGGDGACTLREALANANSDSDTTGGDCAAGAGMDSIGFNVDGGGAPAIIALMSGLPTVSDPVTINGNTQGCASPPCVVLNGAVALGASGLRLTASGNTVRGLVIQNFNAVGVMIESSGNFIEGCFVGTDVTGTSASPNGSDGIQVLNAPFNTIGGTTVAARNLVSGNADSGIYVAQTGAFATQILGNYIGIDVTGTLALGNDEGVVVYEASSNTIGDSLPGARNVISGNNIGVLIGGFLPRPENNDVRGNLIGTDPTGTTAIGNLADGVYVGGDARSNRIGSIAIAAGNLISANGGSGVILTGEARDNDIIGNRVGTDTTGTTALGNALHGVKLSTFETSNTVGGTTAGAGNVISANGGHGIWMTQQILLNTIQGNRIGTDVSGTSLLGNALKGLMIDPPGGGHTVGGPESGAGNVIAGNGEEGIAVVGSFGLSAILIQGNSILANGRLGIDLGEDGVTTNDFQDLDDGENRLQNFPILVSADATLGWVTIVGSLNSRPNRTYRIEFFASSDCDGSGNGEGERYLGFREVTTDAAGDGTFNFNLTAKVGDGEAITATATHPWDDTSEFSPCISAECEQISSMGQTIVAHDASTFRWEGLADVRFVKGDLNDVGTYLTTGRGSLQNATSLDISLDSPEPGSGLYYLLRYLACGSWQTTLGAQPERDLALP